MERFEDLLGRIVRVGKKDLEKVEREAEGIIEETLGLPPQGGEAIVEED